MQDAEFVRKIMFKYTHSVSCIQCSDCSGLNQFVTDDRQTCVDCSEHFWGDDVIFYGAFRPHICKSWGLMYIIILTCICFCCGLKAFIDSRDTYRGGGHGTDKDKPYKTPYGNPNKNPTAPSAPPNSIQIPGIPTYMPPPPPPSYTQNPGDEPSHDQATSLHPAQDADSEKSALTMFEF